METTKNIMYKELTIKELEEIICKASEEIEKRKLAEASNIRAKIKVLLNDSGLSLSDVFQDKLSSKKQGKVAMKYENPDDLTQQWSGRGKMPVWLRDKVEAGMDKEIFRIMEKK